MLLYVNERRKIKMRIFRCFKTKEEREKFIKIIGKDRLCFKEPTSYSKKYYQSYGVNTDVYKYAIVYRF